MRVLTLCAACAALAACGDRPSGRLATQLDSVSYLIGYQIGGSLKQQGAPAPTPAILRGLTEGYAGTKSAMSDSLARATMMAFQQKSQNESRKNDSIATTKNETDAAAFFPDNGKKAGVQTTKSGLQWRVVREGKGPRPGPTSVVKVHYKGTLLSGEGFDSSYERGPVEFALNEVIPGWTEAVALMNAGAKYEFWIPSALAYGPRGSPPMIGPNAALKFEVELISFR